MRVASVVLLAAVGLVVAPSSAAACHPVPDPPPAGYYDHGCGDTTKGGTAKPRTLVTVGDDFFDPVRVTIQPGERVTWRWDGASQHRIRAFANQTKSFGSAFMSGTGKTFAHDFAKAGRFTYRCDIHPATMRGAVEVGPAPFPDTSLPRVAGVKAKVSGSTAKLSFRLSERSRISITLSGPSRRTVTRVLAKGKRSLRFRRLHAGRYRVSLRPTDTAGNEGRTVKDARFSVR